MGAYSCDVGIKRWDMGVKSNKFGGGAECSEVGIERLWLRRGRWGLEEGGPNERLVWVAIKRAGKSADVSLNSN